TNRVGKTIHTGGTPTCIRAGAGSIWVASQGEDKLFRIDPATNRVTTIATGSSSVLCVDPHDDAVWLSNDQANTVTRLDTTTNRIVATIKVGSKPADGVQGPDGLEWIPNQGD